MEFLDLVDDLDQVIGKESRDSIYRNGRKNYRGVNIFIFNAKGELLVPQRSANRKIFPNCYDFSVSEHVVAGEDYLEAAYRGLQEELGITDLLLEEVGYFRPEDMGTSCFSRLYRAVYDGKLEFDQDGIDRVYYWELAKVKELLNDNPQHFKGDYPKLFGWYLKKFGLG